MLEVGSKIKILKPPRGYNAYKKDEVGIVIFVVCTWCSQYIAVKFDTYSPYRHDCNGQVKTGYGYYIDADMEKESFEIMEEK